jgi:quercetin dioxygenase-like cupin family protein
MKSKKLSPDVFEDHRGVILSFPLDVSDLPVVEYNLMITSKGDERGYHYHPHFDEYMIVVEGECLFKEFSTDGDHKEMIMKVGDSIKIPTGTSHTFKALTDFKFVSLLTKRWDDSEPPIVKVDNDGNEL